MSSFKQQLDMSSNQQRPVLQLHDEANPLKELPRLKITAAQKKEVLKLKISLF